MYSSEDEEKRQEEEVLYRRRMQDCHRRRFLPLTLIHCPDCAFVALFFFDDPHDHRA